MDILIITLVFVIILCFWQYHQKKSLDKFVESYENKVRDLFGSLANSVLNDSNQNFLQLAETRFGTLKAEAKSELEKREKSFENLLAPLSTMILEYKESIERLKSENIKSFTSVGEVMKQISEQANNLSIEILSKPKCNKSMFSSL
jgi:methyl-accepting chemotaxis protein